ncbi:tetratricopeptide repeat protein [Amycolatopsis sp. NBC_01488]|uniref:tetratricopeptide repeat protein n=1 Tax=Amycolatopsis sp. NBC_01488 TaxID=2903563 RepID=UPI002E2B6F7F|nr:tetratricopeptide repeat protein [Amycolatopsis sp. NBC_01488]
MSSNEDARTLTAQGAALREEDRHEEAVPVLREAVAAHEPDADRLLALTLMETGDLEDAKQVLVDAVANGQTNLAGLLGDVADDLEDDELAESSYRQAVDAGDKDALNDYGVFLRSRERYAEAIDILQRAIAEGDSLAAANLVSLYFDDLGDLDTAERLALRHLSRDQPSTYVALANVYAEQGRLDEAEDKFQEAVGLEARKVHQNYALFLWEKREDLIGAEREFRLAKERDEPGWGYELGSFLVELGREDEARIILSTAASWGDVDAEELLEEIESGGNGKTDR